MNTCIDKKEKRIEKNSGIKSEACGCGSCKGPDSVESVRRGKKTNTRALIKLSSMDAGRST